MENSDKNDVSAEILEEVLKTQCNPKETFIATDLKEDEQEFPGLDITVYNQEVLEKKILDQVDRAIESQKLKDNAESLSRNENLVVENQKKSKNDEYKKIKEKLEDFCIVDATEETEKEKKIRMGEMTPFGTVISHKTIEGNHLENIEKYLQNQVKIINEQRGLKRKNDAETPKTNNARNLIQSTSKRKKISAKYKNLGFCRKKSLETLENENNCDSQKNLKKLHFDEHDDDSGSEYIPSESNSEDPDFELEPKVLKTKRKRKKLKSSTPDEADQSISDYEYSNEGKIKVEKDDGDYDKYLLRLEKWEKENCRDDIETQVRNLDDGFKMPLVIWNKLYNYQRVGVQWLWELNLQQCGGIVGDEMGLGKTIQVISFLAGLSISKLISRHGFFQGLGPVLIVCPTTVMHQWIKEFHQWWPQFRVALLHESGTYSGRKTELIRNIVKTNGILITSYVTCIQQSQELLRHTWHYVILDEGHKIRNPDSQITITVKLLKTPHRLILSGSPMQNNLKELWSLFDFIFPGKLGTLPVFLAEFGVPITQGGYANASKIQVATAFKCATVLRDTISPYLLRRAKEDVKTHINLPPKNEQVLFCRLTEEQKELYVNYINSGKVLDILNGKQRVFVGLIDLRKICNHPHLFLGEPKLSKWNNQTVIPEEEQFGFWKKAGKMIVMETLLKLWKKQGHRVLIFTQSRKMLGILERFVRSQNYEYIKIDGSTTIGSRQPLITKFNENKKYYIFLSTTHVGGLGVNLTGANRVVIYDPDWNPATDAQARERAWRIGQENQVTIYRLVTSGTIEEKIYHRQIFKQFLTNKVLKDPSQRRFFKSNDLYELFTFKDSEHSNETSSIFAGTNYELNLNNFPKRQKKQSLKNKLHFQLNSIKNDVEAQQILTKEKIERMKQMAQTLSRKIALDALKERSKEDVTINNTTSEGVEISEDKQTFGSKNIKNETLKPIDAIKNGKKIKKLKKKKSCDKRLDGEVVPHLHKQKQYRDVLKDAINYDKDDDYILKKLFSKSGVQSALKHDQIMESGPADYALIEGEAEKIAKEAVKALKESRKQYAMTFKELSSIKPFGKPRFGKKTFRQLASNSPSGDSHNADKNKVMTSAELLQRIRLRNGLCSTTSNTTENPVTENSELLTNIRNFISFGAEIENKATTQEIIDKFRERLPTGQTPLFKALLNEICEFHRTPRGEGLWELRPDFRSEIMTDLKNASPKDSKNGANDSQEEKCESVWLASGPPFDQRDYMISPSETCSSFVSEENEVVKKKTKYGPGDIKIESKYVLSSGAALEKLVELTRIGCIRPYMRRIKNLITKYLQGCTSGYPISDIPLIVEVIEYFARNRTSNPEFSEFVVILLCVAKNPPIVENSSNILKIKKILIDYFTLFGELLATFEEERFQVEILEALECLVFRRQLSSVTAVKLSTCHEAIEESQLPYVIAVLMETISYNLYFSYLDVAIQIVMVSLKAGQTMIQRNLLSFILLRLNYCPEIDLALDYPSNVKEETILNDYYLLLEKSSYLIWGLLTIVSKHDVDTPVPSECALRSLRIVFERESVKKSQRALASRNNLAGLLVKLCAVFKGKLALFESGLLVDIALMSVATEAKTENAWLKACRLGTKAEDNLLKKLMLVCCCIVKDKKSIEVLKNFKVIEGVLSLINPEESNFWTHTQFVYFFHAALRTLSELAPELPEVFVLQKGNARLLYAMKLFMDQHFDRATLLELLRTFCTVATCENNKCVIDDIVAQDGVQTILELCAYLIDIKSIKLEDQEKLIRIFFLLEIILRNNQKLLIKHQKLCTSIAIALLKRVRSDFNYDSKWNPKLLVSFGGFLWEAIAWCQPSLDSFVKQEGIFLILDIIERGSFPVQMLYLGILVDILDDGRGIAHVITWRGKNGFGILDLMIEIWRKEERITKVHRTKEGIIQDIEIPLMTEEQWYLTYLVRGGHHYSPSVAEMVCSARPKIHAIYQFLQKRYFDLTSISESCYSLYLKNVQPSNQIYIPLIEHFLVLKMGEIWLEVLRDLNISGIIPTAYDGKVVCSLLDEKNKWSSRIKTMQEEILVMQRKGLSGEENQLYDLLKEFRKGSALEALRELDFVARTSVPKFQEQKKQKQIRDMNKSICALSLSSDVHIHRTFLYKTNITCFCANYVKVKSEKGAVEKEDILTVSSESSDENRFEIDDCC